MARSRDTIEHVTKADIAAAKRKRAVSPTLTTAAQIAIGRWKRKHPQISVRELCERYDATPRQVRTALQKFEAGVLIKPNRHNVPRKKINELKTLPPEELLAGQLAHSIAQLEADAKMDLQLRVSLLDRLTSMIKTMQQVALTGHLRSADAQIIAIIIRRYVPEATDDDVIRLYHEAKQTLLLLGQQR